MVTMIALNDKQEWRPEMSQLLPMPGIGACLQGLLFSTAKNAIFVIAIEFLAAAAY
jgi:hypothetical protein